MAYLKELLHRCHVASCNRQAKVTVFNHKNADYGDYCRPCGKSKLLMLQREEKMQDIFVRSSP